MVESPQICRCLNKRVSHLTAVICCKTRGGCKWLKEKGLGGSIVEPPWKQTKEIGIAWAKVQNSRRYARLITSPLHENMGSGKDPQVQGVTHTHTLMKLHTDLMRFATRQPGYPNSDQIK